MFFKSDHSDELEKLRKQVRQYREAVDSFLDLIDEAEETIQHLERSNQLDFYGRGKADGKRSMIKKFRQCFAALIKNRPE